MGAWSRRRCAALALVAVALGGCGEAAPEAAPDDDLVRRTVDDETVDDETSGDETSGDETTGDKPTADGEAARGGDRPRGDASPSGDEASPGGDDMASSSDEPVSDDPSAADAVGSDVVPPSDELPDPMGRDWQQVAQAIVDLQVAAYEELDTSPLARVAASTCNCWDHDVRQITLLQNEGWQFVLQGRPIVTAAQVVQQEELTDSVVLLVDVQNPDVVIVDSDGEEVNRLDAGTRREQMFVGSDEGPQGPWRLFDLDVVPVDGDE